VYGVVEFDEGSGLLVPQELPVGGQVGCYRNVVDVGCVFVVAEEVCQ